MKPWKDYYLKIGVSKCWFSRCRICGNRTKDNLILVKSYKKSLRPQKLYHTSCFIKKFPKLGKELKRTFIPEFVTEEL